ncbi:plasmid SOS inhibition protein A [Serratia fonticola]|uniref:Plasmid SOS inhibition protein A n=1 Tax=Serratia fonticola TaxID=47917 RepID=A0AAJ1YIK7_SERFO|nr:plasmid SOS inhibition protein A [Serratia fonticola]MDQ9128509.1 plasmid SOS inhibition protein A [Serratia fonticola]
MIPNHLALVPVNSYQLAAVKASIAVEDKIQRGKKLGQYPYARQLFGHLCGSQGKIRASDVRWAAGNYDPKVRNSGTKESYIRALDTLLASRGEICPHPLSTDQGHLYFPEVRYRLRERQYRKTHVKVTRQANHEDRQRQLKRRRYQVQIAQAGIELAFTTPSELTAWYKRQERMGVYDDDLVELVQAWGERFINLHSESFYCGQPLWVIVKDIGIELEGRNDIEQWLDELMLPNKLGGRR